MILMHDFKPQVCKIVDSTLTRFAYFMWGMQCSPPHRSLNPACCGTQLTEGGAANSSRKCRPEHVTVGTALPLLRLCGLFFFSLYEAKVSHFLGHWIYLTL